MNLVRSTFFFLKKKCSSLLKKQQKSQIMFASFFRKTSDRDLEQYRNGYPGKKDNNDPKQNLNLLFYTNQHPMIPDGIKIDVFHSRIFGKYGALESGHSFIQWLFPIQEESPYNWQAQQLQKQEIKAMKSNPEILKRIFRSLRLMLDFYGFDISLEYFNNNQQQKQKQQKENEEDDDDEEEEEETETKQNQKQQQQKSKAVQQQQQKPKNQSPKRNQRKNDDDDNTDEDSDNNENDDDDEENPNEELWEATFPWKNLCNARATVTRQPDAKNWKGKFQNLLTHTHNNLRITRILKCLGEMGLENLKLATLAGFKHEIFESMALLKLADSYLNYWSGTIYNDQVREQFQSIPADQMKVIKAKLKK